MSVWSDAAVLFNFLMGELEKCTHLIYLIQLSLSLLQLFDEDNPVHKSGNKYMFTTEGHIVSVDERFRNSLWQDILPGEEGTEKVKPNELKAVNFSSNVRNALIVPGGVTGGLCVGLG